jgi:uncharacterized protein YlxW (UPF0749 family)
MAEIRMKESSDLLLDMFRNPLDPGYAGAARRRVEVGPPSPAARRAGRLGRGVVFAATGFIFAIAYQHTVAAQPASSRAHSGLVADVRARRAQTDDLQRHADQLRDDVSRLRDQALAGSGGEAARLRELEAGTGLARVHGPGVVVRVGDGPAPVDPVSGKPSATNPGLVLDRDLQDIVNALWRAGAEAIAINDQRLTATSTIRAAGNAILVDFRPVTGPYEIAAVGPADLDKRFNALSTARRFRRYVEVYRMQFSVKAQKDLTLPASAGPQLRYAHTPASSPSASPR